MSLTETINFNSVDFTICDVSVSVIIIRIALYFLFSFNRIFDNVNNSRHIFITIPLMRHKKKNQSNTSNQIKIIVNIVLILWLCYQYILRGLVQSL